MLAGMRAEHVKVLLQDHPAPGAPRLRRHPAGKPSNVVSRLAVTRLTALSKLDGGARAIATSDMFRRLVLRALAKGLATTFDRATRPYKRRG